MDINERNVRLSWAELSEDPVPSGVDTQGPATYC